MVIPVRDAIKQVNLNYVKILWENGRHTNFLKEKMGKLIKWEVVYLTFTSLCRFPVYDADFGWGEPVWVGSAKWLYKNLVTFLDTKSRSGIEVWINLDEEDMSKFEVDKELLAYVSSVKLSTWLSWIDNQGWGKNGLLSVFAIFFFFNVYFKFYISLKWGEVSQCSSSMRSSLSYTMSSICVDLIWGEMVVSWDCKMIFLLVCNIICLFHGIKRRYKKYIYKWSVGF